MPADTKSIDDIMSSHFDDDNSPNDVVEQVEEVVEEEVSEQTEEVEEIEEETEQEEESEEDYESEIPEKESEKKPEKKNEHESHARRQAKEEGQRRKALEAEKKEWEIERDRLSREVEENKAKLKEFQTTRIKPEEHPDYVSKRDEIISNASRRSRSLKLPHNKSDFKNGLGNLIKEYRIYQLADDSVQDEKLEEVKNSLTKRFFGEENGSYDELDRDDQREIDRAFDIIEESAEKAENLESVRQDLEKRFKNGTLAVGVREYENNLKEFQPILDSVGDLADDVIEENPYSIEAIVAAVGRTEKGKSRLNSAKKDAIEVIFGPRPLSQEEIKKYEDGGGSYKELLANREKALNEKRKRLLPIFAQALVAKSTLSKHLSELAELRGKKESEESEDDAIRKITKKKVTPKPEVKKIKSLSDIYAENDLDD